MPDTDYCQCDKTTPTTWLGTCDVCGKKYLFPYSRPRVLHPLPFEEAKEILIDVVRRSKEYRSWRGLPDWEWNEAFRKLLDAAFLNIKEGFFLLGCGVFCNPRLSGLLELYFTDRRGAELWKELDYSGALYSLDICEKTV